MRWHVRRVRWWWRRLRARWAARAQARVALADTMGRSPRSPAVWVAQRRLRRGLAPVIDDVAARLDGQVDAEMERRMITGSGGGAGMTGIQQVGLSDEERCTAWEQDRDLALRRCTRPFGHPGPHLFPYRA